MPAVKKAERAARRPPPPSSGACDITIQTFEDNPMLAHHTWPSNITQGPYERLSHLHCPITFRLDSESESFWRPKEQNDQRHLKTTIIKKDPNQTEIKNKVPYKAGSKLS
jgi:hypothetical protein